MLRKYKDDQEDNVKLKDMKEQLTEMENDYEVMLRAREESKKQMEAKFQDIFRQIQANKDFTNSEVKRVNDTLKAFESKFGNELGKLRAEFEGKIASLREYDREQLRLATERMDLIEASIEQEKQDRLRETEETLHPVKTHLSSLQR